MEKTDTTTKTGYTPKGFAAWLNKFFGFAERGGTMKGEIVAGVSIFLLSVCMLLVNTRVIGQTLGATSAEYCGIYLAAAITSFLGTLAIGLIARLPLVQLSSLSLTSSFIALVGAGNGLTYQNMLAVTLLSAIIYTVVVSIPVCRNFLKTALPKAVRKALPVAMGLYVVLYALNSIGLVSLDGGVSFVGVSGITEGTGRLAALGAIAAIIAMIAVLVFVKLKKSGKVSAPIFFSILTGFIIFYVVGVFYAFSLVFSTDRVYMTAGAENLYTIGMGFSGIDFGSVFTKGFDFSAYTGNVAELFISGMFVFFFMSMYESDANIQAACLLGEYEEDEKRTNTALICCGATNIFAALIGSCPLSIGKQSAAGAVEGGKSGLTSVVAAIGFFIALFTWVFFTALASTTGTVTDYGHATSNSFAEYAQAGFAVIDGVMLVVGLLMMKGIKGIDASKLDELLPFAATICGFVFTFNIVIGVCAGLVAYVICKLLSCKAKEIKAIGIPTAVLTVVMIIVLAL
ncbi:MAG: hypothetical protein LUD51_02865 [Clostridia bacterium]|nr:hypothetical protein [Clostridia bacterium]